MGVIKRGLLGGFSGRVGNIVGSSWKGIAVIKTLPLSVANPKTAKQIKQRVSFADTVLFAVQLLTQVIKPAWDRFASRMSGFNAFVSKNVKLYNEGTISPAVDFVILEGKMAATPAATVVKDDVTKTLSITWVDDSNEGLKLSNDVFICAAWTEDLVDIAVSAGDTVRGDTMSVVEFKAGADLSKKVVAGFGFIRADGTIVSAQTKYIE
jgi:hypothetical protein